MIAIVGGGVAGVSAAEALREMGYTAPVRVFCAEPLIPYERPTLSKGFLVAAPGGHPPPLRPGTEFAELGITLELGVEVVEVDPGRRTLVTSNKEEIPYDLLLLATGAAPRRLDAPGVGLEGIHYLRELDDAQQLRCALRSGGSVVIVGGGMIGLEVASSAIALGAAVTVVEATSQVMGRIVPSDFATLLEEFHRARGMTIRTGVRPVAFEGTAGRLRGVVLDDGSLVPAETALVGVGAVPRTDLAARAGLTVDDGILVDEDFRTSDDRIFAAGDVARVFHAGERRHVRLEQWRPALEQGRQAAASMLNAGMPYREVPWMWSDQNDLHVQATGFGFAGADVVCRGDLDGRGGIAYLGVRDGRLAAACGVSLGTGIARTVRAAQTLIQHGAPVHVDELADPGFDLRRLARGLRGPVS